MGKAIKNFEQLQKEFVKIEDKFLPQNSKSQYLEFIVIKKSHFIYNYLKLTLLLNDELNDQFIFKEFADIKENTRIKVKLDDIKFKTLNNTLYFEIQKIENLTSNSKNILNEHYNHFNFTFHTYANCLFELENINYNSLISIPVKIKEKETDSNESKIIFKDINKKKLNINFDKNKFKIEGQKKYLLEGFLLKENKNLIQLKNSSITEIDESLDKNRGIEQSSISKLFNFKGKINEFDLKTKFIKVINEEDKNQYSIELNNELLSKISINCICQFIHFSKIDETNYKYNYFSDIKYNQKTYISLNFLDFNEKYYNRAICDKVTKEINEKNIILEIDDNPYKNVEIKTLIFQKINENKIVECQKQFNLEVNIGKLNKFDSLLKKNEGYAYQFYYQSTDKDLLPKKYQIKDVNNEVYEVYPENNENEFYQRFTIINVPFQNIEENYKIDNLSKFSLNEENKEEENGESLKYLFSLNGKITEFHKFKLTKGENYENFYNSVKFYEKDLEIFFKNYFFKEYKLLYRDIIYIQDQEKDHNILNLFSNKNIEILLNDVLQKGFNKYIFNNNKKDYLLMKYLCFAVLCLKAKTKITDEKNFGYILFNFKDLLTSLNMEYIDKIKALIAITKENLYNKLEHYDLHIAKAKEKDSKYFYYGEALETFMSIINGLQEKSKFYKGLRQFNGIILEDKLTNKNMYSGTILNLKDIQIELMKSLSQFCLIQKGVDKLYASYWKSARTIILNPDYYLGIYYKETNLRNNIKKRMTACTLFVLFHEIVGHMKTHINNEADSPNQIYLNDFKLVPINIEKPDSGFLFEYILSGKLISCKYFMNSKISEELLDENLYLGENFSELREKLDQIKYVLSSKVEAGVDGDKKKVESMDELCEDINYNYYNMSFNDLFIFFSNLDEEKKMKMKDSEAYKYFLSFYREGKKI